MAGKHSSDESFEFDFKPIKKIFKSISFTKVLVAITVLVVIVGVVMSIKMITESKNVQTSNNNTENVPAEVTGLPETHEGYNVLGKIKIEKINVEQYILDSKENDALEKGVTKLYGGDINSLGNFCISGHNYDNVFKKLNELEVGDVFVLIDKEEIETKYEIKEIFSVEPDDLTCLLQDDSKTEVTLITCENGATTRLIVKAEKKI